jgi:hypothetical protein
MFPAAAVLVALAAPPAPAAPAPAPAEAFVRAEKLFAADRFGEAEPLFRAALATDDRSLKRRAYDRLMGLYLRSGRPDRAVRLAEPFRAWLKEIGETDFAALDLLLGQCRLDLGYAELADEHLAAALRAKSLPPGSELEALRLRADVAAQRRDPAEKDRLAELGRAARAVLKDAVGRNSAADRVAAGRGAADAAARRAERAGH